MEVTFINPFNDGKDVYIIGSFTYGDRINITNLPYITTIPNGRHEFNYIYNNVETYSDKKLYTINSDGKFVNYLTIKDNQFDDKFLIDSDVLEDIDVYVTEGNRNRDITANYNEMMTQYIKAINLNCTYALIQMGIYYRDIKKDYDEMKRSFAAAISKGDSDGFIYLGDFHTLIDKDYDKAVACYMMAIKHQSANANEKLAECFVIIVNDENSVKNPSLLATAKEYLSHANNINTT